MERKIVHGLLLIGLLIFRPLCGRIVYWKSW